MPTARFRSRSRAVLAAVLGLAAVVGLTIAPFQGGPWRPHIPFWGAAVALYPEHPFRLLAWFLVSAALAAVAVGVWQTAIFRPIRPNK